MTRRYSVVALAALAVALATPALASDVSGKWKLTSKSPRGERTSEITLAQSGEKLTVTSQDREGNEVKSEGSVKGAEVTWTTKRSGPMGEMVIVYTGKIDGKTMSGTTQFGEMGSGEWKAEKVEP
jgi:opacity protein-like surface antigen